METPFNIEDAHNCIEQQFHKIKDAEVVSPSQAITLLQSVYVPQALLAVPTMLALLLLVSRVNVQVLPISIGGDHSITLPIFRVLARDGPIGMVHFDAHCDTGDNYAGSKFHHGSPFKVVAPEMQLPAPTSSDFCY